MKELDFDELDRAVSSLMSDTAGSVPDSSESPKEKTLDIPSSPTAKSTASFDTLQPDVVKKAVEQPPDDNAPVNAAPAIRRSSGRFMDVVHPSSDMKQPTPQKPTTRQGVTISPAPSPLVVPSTLPDVVADDKPKDVEPTQDTVSEWPDPLDVAGPRGTDSNQESTLTDLTVEDKAPLTSPFLSDAKVEKRPLGGAVTSAEQPSEPVADAALPEQDHSVADGASPRIRLSSIRLTSMRRFPKSCKATLSQSNPAKLKRLQCRHRKRLLLKSKPTTNQLLPPRPNTRQRH